MIGRIIAINVPLDHVGRKRNDEIEHIVAAIRCCLALL